MPIEDFKELLATTASVTQIFQVLSGVLAVRTFIKKGSSTDFSPLPYLTGCVGSSLWLYYGTLIHDTALTLVNSFSLLFFLTYVFSYYLFSARKVRLTQQVLLCSIFTGCVFLYIHSFKEDEDEAKNRLGIIASVVSVLFFAAPLANLAHVIRVKSCETLPFPMILMNLIVTFLWASYGYVLKDKYIAYPNLMALMITSLQMSLFVIYPGR